MSVCLGFVVKCVWDVKFSPTSDISVEHSSAVSEVCNERGVCVCVCVCVCVGGVFPWFLCRLWAVTFWAFLGWRESSYVTLDHKTSHEGQLFQIEIYTSSESWINKMYGLLG